MDVDRGRPIPRLARLIDGQTVICSGWGVGTVALAMEK